MKAALQRIWLAKTWKAKSLLPVSMLYRLLTSLRKLLYRAGIFKSAHVGIPTIVVGNVVAGGAGKTPLVIAMVSHLQAQGIAAGVVSRGYGRVDVSTVEVTENTPVYESGDEPALTYRASGAPVFVAKKRVDAALALLKAYPETQVLISDDGLQHYALKRDVEVVVFDDRGIGNGWLLPAGPLREPWRSQDLHKRLVLHTGQHPAFAGFTSTRKLHTHAIAADGTAVALADLRHLDIVALAGIANPEAFFAMLRAQGLNLAETISRPDHDSFSTFDLDAHNGKVMLCTEKDAIKLFPRAINSSMTLLAVPLVFFPEPGFYTAFDKLLSPLLIASFSPLPSKNGHKNA